MNERRKIIIPTGANPAEPLPSPHFDAEATLTARPVVPLSEQEAFQMQYGGYAGRVAKPFWKRPALLALIVLVATGIGVAAGLAIGIYKNRKNAEPPVVSAPSAPVENANVDQTIEQPQPTPAPQARVTIPENPVEIPTEPKDEERERAARDKRKSDDEMTPPVARDKKRDKTDGDDGEVLDEKQVEKDRRREERRERRRRQREEEETIDVPRGIERAERKINRIREIFEGRQP